MLVKIATINIHGIKTVEKRNMLNAFCLDRKLDIVIIFIGGILYFFFYIYISISGRTKGGRAF